MTRSISQGDDVRSTETSDASPDDVVGAIRSLRGDGEVYLGHPTGTFLGIAGGPTRFFVGYCDADGDGVYQAMSGEPPGEDGTMRIGGQPTMIAARYLVTLDVALTAALYYLHTRELWAGVDWDRM